MNACGVSYWSAVPAARTQPLRHEPAFVRPSVRLCGYAGWLGANAAFAETFGQTVQLCIYVFMMFFFAVYSTLTLHCCGVNAVVCFVVRVTSRE